MPRNTCHSKRISITSPPFQHNYEHNDGATFDASDGVLCYTHADYSKSLDTKGARPRPVS